MDQVILKSSYSEHDLNEENHNVYLSLINAEGEQIKLLCDMVPCRSLSGTTSGTLVICQETTHHPSMSAGFLLDNMQAPVFGMDTSMNCVLWNQAMKQLTGIPEEHVFGKLIVHDVFSNRLNGLLHVQAESALLNLEVAMLQVTAHQPCTLVD